MIGSRSQGTIDANSTTYNESTVTAKENLDFSSGKDTNIKGGMLSGEKVTGNVGGDLNIESRQDSNNYTEENTSAGFGLELNLNNSGKVVGSGVTGALNEGNIDSNYSSVTDQSGIYAGKEGFDIRVEENTDLKGGIIASEAEAEKNKISTGTLTYEDIKNKAEYEAESKGIAVDTTKDAEKKDAGVTPNIGMPAGDEAESTTKATIAEGEIEIRDKENQKQDLAGLNRDTQNSLNKLGEIFDRDDVKEKQEFAGLFQKTAHSAIDDLTGKISVEKKATLNAFIDGLVADWANGNFLAGASGTALLESMQNAVNEIEDPALKQIAAGVLGAAAGEIVGGNAQAGASGVISTEKYNHLPHEEQENFARDLHNAKTNNERFDVLEKYYKLSQEFRENDPDGAEVLEQAIIDELGKLTKYDNGGVSFDLQLNKNLGLHENINLAREFLALSKTLSYFIPNTLKDTVKFTVEEGLTTANILSAKKIQILDTTSNIITNYDRNNIPEETIKMILQESTKGYLLYEGGEYAKQHGIPKSIVIITQAGLIILDN